MKGKWLLLFLTSIFVIIPFISTYGQLQKGKIYVVGVGPAGPELCTLQAIKVIQEADIIYTPNYIRNLFANYLSGREVRSDWADPLLVVKGKPYTTLSGQDMIDYTREIRETFRKLSQEFKSETEKGKTVALLVNGDPCIYSDLRWLKPHLTEDDFIVIPGLSSLNVGAAILKKELSPSGKGYRNAIIAYSPLGEEFGVPPTTSDLARHKTTMIFFMAGSRVKQLIRDLGKHYSKDTPVAFCYYIGYPEKQKIIRGQLHNIVSLTASEPETEMVLIYVGNFLNE